MRKKGEGEWCFAFPQKTINTCYFDNWLSFASNLLSLSQSAGMAALLMSYDYYSKD